MSGDRLGAEAGLIDARKLIDALPDAVVIAGADGAIIAWNGAAAALYGWTEDAVLGKTAMDVLIPPSDAERAREVMRSVRSGEPWDGEFTVVGHNHETLRVALSQRPIVGESGEIVGVLSVSVDVTDTRVLEQQTADLAEHLQLALTAGGLGTFRWDLTTGVTEWDERLEALFGLAPGTFGGTFDAWLDLVHPDDVEQVRRTVQDAVADRGQYEVQHRVVWPDGTIRWIQGAGQVTIDAAGNVTGAIGCSRDITAQMQAEEQRRHLTDEALRSAEQERVHRERLEFLSAINDALAVSRTRHDVMVNVAKVAVPRLGDWCSMFVFAGDDDPIPMIETAHVDPEMVDYARALQNRYPYDPEGPTGIPRVIRTGTSEFIPVIDDVVLEEANADAEARAIIERLALTSALAVPVVKRGRTFGAMQFVMAHSRRHYTEDDLTLAEAVAGRIASTLDNIRLVEEQRAIATALQASLLPTALPDVPGVAVAVRYWANGEGVEVGGDFYDVFALDDERWALVIGDVCGTGPRAAAVTGLARHTIAAAAWHGDDHATVLDALNRSMRARAAGPFCTALYGTLERAGDAFTLTVTSGGHPLPIIVRADGAAATVGRPGTLIGVFDTIETTTASTELRSGDTVVLYTDGATDAPPPHDLPPDRLLGLVADAARHADDANGVARELGTRLSAINPIENRADDIALLVLRIR